MILQTKNTKRQERRHQQERVRKHALRVVRTCWGYTPHQGHNRECEMDAWAYKQADNLAKCSCWMCGNARRRDGTPVQERRLETAKEPPLMFHRLGNKRHYRPSWKPYGEISKRKLAANLGNPKISLEDLYREILERKD